MIDMGDRAARDGGHEKLGAVRHTFTHAHLTLAVERVAHGAQPEGEGEWWPLDQIEDAGLPTLFAKAARLALAQS